MRSRPLAVASAIIALSTAAAACGEDSPEETVASTPAATTAAVPPTTDPAATTPAGATTPGAPGTPAGSTPEGEASEGNIIAVAAANPDLTNLTTAIGVSGIAPSLDDKGPVTVFAPNNDAFGKLGTQLDTLLQPASKAQLANILQFHVVKGRVRIKNLKDGELLTTLQGTRLRVTKNGDEVKVGNSLGEATIVAANVKADNGVVHVVDTVLTPKK